jgi:SRSO17 transposase
VSLSLAGLRSHLPRTNAEAIATVVAVERLVMQDFSGPAPWAHRPCVQVWVGEVVERWGAPEGSIAVDPRRFPTRGTHSVGVKRPWCGHRGQVDTCQVGVSMGDVSRHEHAVLAFRLAWPEDGARDQQRRQACQVPEEVRDSTRQAPGLERLDLWGEQGPHGWVTGDAALGRHTRLRRELRERDDRSGLGVPGKTTIRDREAPAPAYHGRGRRPKAPGQSGRAWRQSRGSAGWTRLTVRDGAKGPVELERRTRRVQTRLARKRPGPAAWLVGTRRPLEDHRLWEPRASRDATAQDARSRSQYSRTPPGGSAGELPEPSLAELARVIKAGTCMEASCKRGQGEGGMDASQVRTWQGWHHHMVLSLMAVWCLRGETHRGQHVPSALTLPQVRYGLSLLLLEVFCPPGIDSSCRPVQRQ